MNTTVECLPFLTELATHLVMSSNENGEQLTATTGIIDPNFDVSQLDPAKSYTETDGVHIPVFPPSPDAKNIMVRAVTAELRREYRDYEAGDTPYEWKFTNYFTTRIPVLGTLVTVQSSDAQVGAAAKKIFDVQPGTPQREEHVTVVGQALHTKLIAGMNGIKQLGYNRSIGARGINWAAAYQFRDSKWNFG